MSEILVSEPNNTFVSDKLSLLARIRNCDIASSPEMYMTLFPCFENAAAACIRMVDLPIPGSPPSKIADPSTIPPPQTRSNSSIPVILRGFISVLPCKVVKSIICPF